jgi:hypothetical protein
MNFLIEGQSNYVSPALEVQGTITGRYEFDIFIRGNLGSGKVKVLVKSQEDGEYYPYTNLVYEDTVAETISLKTPFFKIQIEDATEVTVEVH